MKTDPAKLVGRIGKDSRGMRFVVLDARNVGGQPGSHVAALPGGREPIASGTCLTFSWVEHPVEWEDEE